MCDAPGGPTCARGDTCYNTVDFRGCSSVGRTPPCQGEGHGFESRRPLCDSLSVTAAQRGVRRAALTALVASLWHPTPKRATGGTERGRAGLLAARAAAIGLRTRGPSPASIRRHRVSPSPFHTWSVLADVRQAQPHPGRGVPHIQANSHPRRPPPIPPQRRLSGCGMGRTVQA